MRPPAPTTCWISCAARGIGAAPPTVYRALEFLQEQGLVHKLERLSAFVGCIADEDHDHAAQFFICRSCGKVVELEDHELAHALQDAAKRLGFTVAKATIEAEGTMRVLLTCRMIAYRYRPRSRISSVYSL